MTKPKLPPEDRPAALVTGGGVRLGRAIALDLAKAGFDIALHYNCSEDAAEDTASEIGHEGVDCILMHHDLTDIAGLDRLVAEVTKTMPHLTTLVNSASVYEQGTLRTTTPEMFDAQMTVNLKAPFFLTQAFAKHRTEGLVVNILDNKIGFNQFQYGAYLLSKKALADFTRMAALELAPGIRVNGVAPGVILPAEDRGPEYLDWRRQGIPLLRVGDPSKVTRAVRYLVNNDFVTGQVLVVDGGENIAHEGRNFAAFDTK
ncbi:MAG: SDR family oxidoreductase [Rhodospirillum sp.]|nr:SDR family oxidoreductase [Rhodospirillum sp.]MCF8489404.1 SDR family oxidoreductase [Rhodospirillum sp.]MCF8503054.1 SDR family oxidoreductase [Rhodospirillum sp.]